MQENDYNKEVEENLIKLKSGAILHSSDAMNDPNFALTIIVICVHNDEGSFGLVINRPSHMPISEIFDAPPELRTTKRTIFIGGPVEPEGLHLIQLAPQGTEGSLAIAENVYLGGEWDSLTQILATDPKTTRLFLGYSGWGPGQLVDEIENGDWEVYTVDLKKFMEHWHESRFNDIVQIRTVIQQFTIKDH